MADAKIAVFGLTPLGARGDKPEFLGPANRQVVVGEIGGGAKMWIPAFARIDEEHVVAGVFDHAAVIAEVKRELGAFVGRSRENHEEIVGAATEAILKIHTFVLEKGERFAVLSRNALDGKGARELEADGTFTTGFGAYAEIGLRIERNVCENGGVDLVIERAEVAFRRLLIQQRIGSPDVVEALCADLFRLTDERALGALWIDDHVERATRIAFDRGVKKRLRMSENHGEENPQRLRRIDLRGDRIPTNCELGVLNRLNASAAEFAEEF